MTDAYGKILRVSKPYPGHIHDFEIRKKEGSLPPVPIFSGYQGLQNIHSAAVLLQKKKPKGACLTDSERARNEKLARCRISVEHVFAHLKKWQILASRYRGFLQNYPGLFKSLPASITFLSLLNLLSSTRILEPPFYPQTFAESLL